MPNSVMELGRAGGLLRPRRRRGRVRPRAADPARRWPRCAPARARWPTSRSSRCCRRPPRARPTCAAVMSPNKSLPYLIAARGEIAAPADLAGKRFGIGRVGSVDHLLSMKVLEAAGVDVSTLELVGLGQPQARAQALLAGQIDATTMGDRHLHRDRRRPVGLGPRRRRRLLPRRADPLEAQRRPRRHARRPPRRGRGGDRGDHPRLARLRRASRRAGSRRCARPAPTCRRPTS